MTQNLPLASESDTTSVDAVLDARALVPTMDHHRVRFSLRLEGVCPRCGGPAAIELAGLEPDRASPCPACGLGLRPEREAVRRLGRTLVLERLATLEKTLAPWPEPTQVKQGTTSNFDVHGMLLHFLKDMHLDGTAVDRLVLLQFLVLALRPWLLVRFGAVQSALFGHMTMNVENYLCEREVGVTPSDTLDVFCYGPMVSNRALQAKWNRLLTVSQAASLFTVVLPRESPFAVGSRLFANHGNDSWQTWRRTKPHLTFTEAETREAREALEAMGIPRDGTYVCIGERAVAYRQRVFVDAHDQMSASRDATFDQFGLAATALAERGHYVLRMGAATDGELATRHPRIIDYAGRFRSEFMDLYLGATCRFFATPPSGVSGVASICRRPIVFINYYFTKVMHHWLDNILFLLPRLRHRDSGALLCLAEYCRLEQPLGNRWENHDLLYEPNTPEEILQACLEMDDRLSGRVQDTEEDRRRQARFGDLLTRHARGAMCANGQPYWAPGMPFRARIGSRFLREHPELLRDLDPAPEPPRSPAR